MIKNIYDIKIKDVEGNEDFLQQFKGKVTLFVNVTGHCGNAPQYGTLEKIYQTYKDKGFEVIAIPTNDYCGPKVTYGIYEKGITDAKMAEDYAKSEWNVSYKFSELVVSRENRGDELEKNPHELYLNLNPSGEEAPINGNFEKFLVSKNGKVILRMINGALLSYAYNDGLCDSPEEEYNKLCAAIEQALGEEYVQDN